MSIEISMADVGRHVFTLPGLFEDGLEAWLKNPTYEIDTEAVILLDEKTNRLGYVYIRNVRQGDDKYMRETTMWFLGEVSIYATQEDAIRAAIQDERYLAENFVRACEMFAKKLDAANRVRAV